MTDFPGQADLVRECKSGLVIDSNNPHQLAEAVNFLAQNPEEAHLMGKNGRRAVEENYSWEKQAQKTQELLERLMGD